MELHTRDAGMTPSSVRASIGATPYTTTLADDAGHAWLADGGAALAPAVGLTLP